MGGRHDISMRAGVLYDISQRTAIHPAIPPQTKPSTVDRGLLVGGGVDIPSLPSMHTTLSSTSPRRNGDSAFQAQVQSLSQSRSRRWSQVRATSRLSHGHNIQMI